MRTLLVVSSLLLGSATSAGAQVSVGIAVPGIQIGIRMPVYPELVVVPGHPVYYAPGAELNYFFYDGAYWVYEGDTWYVSSWYDGPWHVVAPDRVPLYVLRVPVRYYRRPPPYFRSWHADAPPRWGERWGRGWERHRRGWDRWDRRAVPRPAPLPVYQRQYHGDRYPHAPDHQHSIRAEQYRYRPREAVARERFEPRGGQWRGEPRGQEPRRREGERHERRDHGRHDGRDRGERGRDHGRR